MSKTFKTISEIGINHNGDMEACKKLIKVSAECGFDYVKFQKRDPEVCVPASKRDDMRDTPWGKMKYIDYKHRVEFQQKQYDAIDEYCLSLGIQWFASAFDEPSIAFLAQYLERGRSFAGIIKLGSAACIEMNLCEVAAKLFPPGRVMISLGMKTEAEIRECVRVAKPFCVLHTVSVYPTKNELLFLNYITRMRRSFPELEIGYSGHEGGLAPTFAAAALGCTWFERHTTLDKNMWGTDQKASLDPMEMQKLIGGLRELEAALSMEEGERYLLPGEREKRSFFVEPEVEEEAMTTSTKPASETGMVCLIPARGGNMATALKKNLKYLKGKPLIAWSIEVAKAAGVFDGIYVSTEDKDVAAVAFEYGAKVHHRSKAAAGPTSTLKDVLLDFEEESGVDFSSVMVLNPTSPLRTAETVRKCAKAFKNGDATFLVTCQKLPLYIWEGEGMSAPKFGYGKSDNIFSKPRTQDIKPHYSEVGTIYVTSKGKWQNQPCTKSNTIVMEVSAAEAIDIGHNTDLLLAEILSDA